MIEVVFLLKVCIRSIRITTVSDVGSVNIGTTLNIVQRTGNGEEPADQVTPAPAPGTPSPGPSPGPTPTPTPSPGPTP